jgi:hypothetical protein
VQLDQSTIVSFQMNGRSKAPKFSAQINIDPAKPEASRARIEIDRQIDAGSTGANDEVKSKSWFSTRDSQGQLFQRGQGAARRFEASKMTMKARVPPFHFSKKKAS